MGRLINTTSMTVDGVTDVSDWFVAEGDHDAVSRSLFEGSAALLTGRKTTKASPATGRSRRGPGPTSSIPLPKFVASRSSLGPLDWNATALEGNAVDAVRQLKAEHDGDLVMSGSGELARELIQARVVDELLFWIHPRIQGPGTRPYEAAKIPVRLLEARQFDSGFMLLRYEPVTAATPA